MEWAALTENFIQIVVVDVNGKKKAMAKCKKCRNLITNTIVDKLKHWKRLCISKYQFKFNLPTNIGEIITVSCLVCHKQFNTITIDFMQDHQKRCAQQMVTQKPQMILPQFQQNVNATSSSINCINETTTTKPGNSVGLNQTMNVIISLEELQYNEKTLKRLPDNKDIQCIECRICKKIFGMEFVLQHRTQCKMVEESPTVGSSKSPVDEQQDILISVQTVHTENINPQQNSTSGLEGRAKPGAILPIRPTCFICNNDASESFVDLYGTASAYTSTNIHSLIRNWLGGKPSMRGDTTTSKQVICSDCLDTINDYDASLVTVKQCKKLLIDKLTKTEAYFERLQNEANSTVTKTVSIEGNSNENDIPANSNLSVSRNGQFCLNKEFDYIDLCEDD